MNFALTGAAGYIAPRHLKAIKETGHKLVAMLDPHDSVGIIDSFFPDCAYFNEPERFDRHIQKLRRGPKEDQIDYISICSPNYLHDAHIRLALRSNSNAICEKPLVLNPWNCDALIELEEETKKKVYTILQLRYHKSVLELKEKIEKSNDHHLVNLEYITSRGKWYNYSWKGNEEKSGGLITNIGIHFFDMLLWIFGNVIENHVDLLDPSRCCGQLILEKATVNWFLSISDRDLPNSSDSRTYRSIKVDDESFEFSGGFTDLHTTVYKNILAGNGYGIADAKPAIELVHNIRGTV